MRTMKKVQKEVEVVEDVFCNKCGKSCQRFFGDNQPGGFYGLIEAEVGTGYLSEPLSDGTSYRFSMCEFCLEVLFEAFTIPVDSGACDPFSGERLGLESSEGS